MSKNKKKWVNRVESKSGNILDIKVTNHGECGWCKDLETITIKIPFHIWTQWMYISKQMDSKEWGGVYDIKEETLENFKIPKQNVTGTECEFEEDLGGNGMVHSHHNMGAFHSAQDDKEARNLYEYSIVLTNSNGYEATKRIKLPCGGYGYSKVIIELTNCPEIALDNIKEKTYGFQNYNQYGNDINKQSNIVEKDGPKNYFYEGSWHEYPDFKETAPNDHRSPCMDCKHSYQCSDCPEFKNV